MANKTKLEKLQEDFAKAETTLVNARKRVKLLSDKIRKEEQRELQSLMENKGLSFSTIKKLVDAAPADMVPTQNDGGDLA